MLMTNKDFEEMILAAMNSDLPEVAEIVACCGDNASESVGFDNRADANGNYTLAFAQAWTSSAQSMLCDYEWGTPAAKAFFKQYGITA